MVTLILDIDGVFNPFDARYNYVPGYFEHQDEHNRIFLNPELMNPFLDEVLKAGHSIIWGSAWEDRSNNVLKMLGRDEQWDYIPLDTEDVGLGTWKIKSVRRWVNENLTDNEPIVWVDDELEPDAEAWAEARGNMLCVTPNRFKGLNETHLQDIKNFLKKF